ncbi:hypothetical protein LPN01_09790 [Sphingomonas sp. A2-49]|uniref:hypothetical protein n=1 Tax=Sphingomonas sp. A2-49 TaxID=1391375 RepID=UPI0021CE4978|nr:hypothetical protein [Sphingomonas sp. A2-49]MCU6454371.1 hypothetical protein [Sphingomonas sp. A2-49]
MRSDGLQECEKLHIDMRTHMLAMQSAGSHEAVVKHWVAVINAYVTIFNKLRAASQGEPKSWAFTNRLKNEMRKDPILAYAYAARGAEEHGIGVGHADLHPIQFSGPVPSSRMAVNPELKAFSERQGMPLLITPQSSFLKPVRNKGRWYSPPSRLPVSTTDNIDNDPSTPINVAVRVCLKTHHWLEEAKTLPAHM